jgi:hypothetical protein
MTRRDNITRWRAKGLWMDALSVAGGRATLNRKVSRTGNPFGDHVFLGAATAVAYKTESWGECGRHLSSGVSSKVATDGPFEAVLGKTRRTEF